MSPQNQVFAASNPTRKYTVEIGLAILLVLAIAGVGLFFALLNSVAQNAGTTLFPRGAEYNTLLYVFIYAPFGIAALVGTKLIVDSYSERALAAPTIGSEILLTNESMQVAISLLEGKARSTLRKNRTSYLTLHFNDVEEFLVEPSRGHRRVSPPYYKIKVRHPIFSRLDCVYILRRPFFGNESKLITAVRERLNDCELILNDTLIG